MADRGFSRSAWIMLAVAAAVFAAFSTFAVWGIGGHYSIKGEGPVMTLVELFGLITGSLVFIVGLVLTVILVCSAVGFAWVSDQSSARKGDPDE